MLQLSYILHEHGWATVVVGNGDNSIETEVSYLSDALGDLARAARGILRGLSEATVRLQQEPGEHRVLLTHDGNRVRAEVYRFDDTFSRSTRGKPLLTAECTLRELATACINCLRHVLDEHGEAGYRLRWKNHEFPMREYRALLDLRREMGTKPPE
jgi:hypothetical protein